MNPGLLKGRILGKVELGWTRKKEIPRSGFGRGTFLYSFFCFSCTCASFFLGGLEKPMATW